MTIDKHVVIIIELVITFALMVNSKIEPLELPSVIITLTPP
jgi:hypothetical protein